MEQPSLRETPALLVQAPAGFGKTSLLAQWRLELIAGGSAVAWITGQAQDAPHRLLQALVLGIRMAVGRPHFGQALLEDAGTAAEGMTRWLAELAQAAVEVVLVIDEVECLPGHCQSMLGYLLRNQPANLRVLLGMRSGCDLEIEDLVNYGRVLRLGTAHLRFDLPETLALARKRLGETFDTDAMARLHALCEGWPLGLQLLLTASETGLAGGEYLPLGDPGGKDLHQALLDLLFSKLSADDLRFLEDIAIADPLHPDLCAALSGFTDAGERLARLAAQTPVIQIAERGEWSRLHSLARARLRERLRARSDGRREELHRRAAEWLIRQDMLDDAASHAWLAGEREQALGLAERSLYDALTRRGRHSMLQEWLERVPQDELQKHPRLQLAMAWALAMSEQHEAASQLTQHILERAGDDAALRGECTLILGTAALYADTPDRFVALHESMAGGPPLGTPLLQKMYANRCAYRLLLAGRPAEARLRLRHDAETGSKTGYPDRWAEFYYCLSHFWEGQMHLAEQRLRPALQRAEQEQGRRSVFAATLAAVLAAALCEQGEIAAAAALLADRLDVLERSALPEAVALGLRTAARVASAQGAEQRALELLIALQAVGQSRRLPRLCLVSLIEQVRLHAQAYRADTCRGLISELDQQLADPALPKPDEAPLWWQGIAVSSTLARGQASIAAREWRAALPHFEQAAAMTQAIKLGRLRIQVLALKAFALERCGEPGAVALIREAIGLAESLSLRRVFDDAHPDVAAWVESLDSRTPGRGPAMATPPREAAAERVTPSMALTPRERDVLGLLARNLANKEIAMAMQVGETTVKWHVKNLFAKLDAGTRRQLVARARILGLLVAAE